MKPSEVIDTMLTEVIPDESKWCRGKELNSQGQHCTVGAMKKVLGGRVYAIPTDAPVRYAYDLSANQMRIADVIQKEAVEHIKSILPDHDYFWEVVFFNDSHTYDEVREVLEKARAGLQEKGQ